MEYISKSENETFKIAEGLASYCQPGDIFALSGDLGSGKTTFTKGFAKSLGLVEEITSPTFVILKQYKLNSHKLGSLIHVDCYRMETVEDAKSVGLPDLIDGGENILLIEWPEKIVDILPSRTKLINFEYIDEQTRKISIK